MIPKDRQLSVFTKHFKNKRIPVLLGSKHQTCKQQPYIKLSINSPFQWLKITSAVIWFEPGTYNLSWIVEHEIGHAFGYKHVEEVGNIMHPMIERMGGKYWKP